MKRGFLSRCRVRPCACLLRLAVNVAALWLAAELLDGVTYDEFTTLLLAALVLGLVNFAVKPLLTLLALPLIILTLGIAYFFVSLAMLLLTSGWCRASRSTGSGPRSAPRSSCGSSTRRSAASAEMFAKGALVAPERQIRPRDLASTEGADLERLLGGLRRLCRASPRRR